MKHLLFDSRMALAAGAAGGLAMLAVWVLMRRRLTPEEKERRRRMAVNEHRRTIEGFLTEASENQLYYHYELAGVEYSTSQDISAIRSVLPADLSRLVGPVSVKYDPRNPANSIIICEDWSGMASIVDAADNQLRKEEPACN